MSVLIIAFLLMPKDRLSGLKSDMPDVRRICFASNRRGISLFILFRLLAKTINKLDLLLLSLGCCKDKEGEKVLALGAIRSPLSAAQPSKRPDLTCDIPNWFELIR